MIKFYIFKKKVLHKLEKFLPFIQSDKVVYKFIKKNFSSITDKYKFLEQKETSISKIIWVFWWQGYQDAPLLVKKCIDSIKEHSSGFDVIIVDENNWKSYASIPDYIIEKLKNKKISLTHFSDILRMSLIAEHGGLWLDATIFVTENIPEKYFEYPFYSIKYETSSSKITKGRWTGFCQAGQKGSVLQSYCRDVFFEYWKKNNMLIDYFLIDYLISFAYDSIPTVKKLIDNVPINNTGIKKLDLAFNEVYDEKKYKNLLTTSIFFKLNWKRKYDKINNSQITNYSHFLSE